MFFAYGLLERLERFVHLHAMLQPVLHKYLDGARRVWTSIDCKIGVSVVIAGRKRQSWTTRDKDMVPVGGLEPPLP